MNRVSHQYSRYNSYFDDCRSGLGRKPLGFQHSGRSQYGTAITRPPTQFGIYSQEAKNKIESLPTAKREIKSVEPSYNMKKALLIAGTVAGFFLYTGSFIGLSSLFYGSKVCSAVNSSATALSLTTKAYGTCRTVYSQHYLLRLGLSGIKAASSLLLFLGNFTGYLKLSR